MYLKKLIFTLPIILALALHADGMIQTFEYQTETNQTITAETWVICANANAQGTYENDLLVGAVAQINLDGNYKENVWAASQSRVDLKGTFGKNVRLIGTDVRINGTIEGNLIVSALNTIIIGTNAVIKGEVQLQSFNSIIQEGRIEGSVVIRTPRSATINGLILGNVDISSLNQAEFNLYAPDIVIAGNAQIGGDLTYTANSDLFPREGAVAGKLKRIPPASPYSLSRLGNKGTAFVAALLVGIPFLSLFPTTTALGMLLIRKSPFKCMLVGVIACVALPYLGIIGISSAMGRPLGALLFVSWGILIYISRILAGLILGTVILRSANTSAKQLLLSLTLGLAVIYALVFISPAIGSIIQITMVCMGSGGLLLTISQRRRMVVKLSQGSKKLEELKSKET
ncbi:MAG: hypothetical protein JXR40_08480 [Pontiellaceae bacterium]|nr:hypothetical protein [Pontiellaceae bacterium]